MRWHTACCLNYLGKSSAETRTAQPLSLMRERRWRRVKSQEFFFPSLLHLLNRIGWDRIELDLAPWREREEELVPRKRKRFPTALPTDRDRTRIKLCCCKCTKANRCLKLVSVWGVARSDIKCEDEPFRPRVVFRSAFKSGGKSIALLFQWFLAWQVDLFQ